MGGRPQGYYTTVAIVDLPDGRAIIGDGQCQLFRFPAVSATELCEELAVMDAGEKLKKYLKGEYKPSPLDKVERLRQRMKQWKRLI